MDDPPHIVLVLANLMAADGTLNAETAARVELGHRIFSDGADYIFFIGWDYREDSSLAIADAMHGHKPGLPEARVLINRLSRDTVGDAILSRRDLEALFLAYRLTVVSSGYHITRVAHVFGRVYGPEMPVDFAASEAAETPELAVSEAASVAAFDKSFEGIQSGDLAGFTERLLAVHPFYNGAVHPLLQLKA